MVRINKSMAAFLKDIDIGIIKPDYSYPIWEKKDKAGRPYWGVSHFFNIDRHGISREEDLSILEWDGNEVNLETHSEAGVQDILKGTIAIIKAWKEVLESDYGNVPFYILASYCDNREELESGEASDFFAITTFRFWAPRGQDTATDLSDFEEWKEPAILIECNN